jgi:hypothetical protein
MTLSRLVDVIKKNMNSRMDHQLTEYKELRSICHQIPLKIDPLMGSNINSQQCYVRSEDQDEPGAVM